MRFKAYIVLLAVFILNLAAPLMAYAAPIDDVRALIASGEYEQARVLAAQIETSDGYALAAESLAAQILLGEVKKLNKHSKEARELAQMALELDPSSYDARLQYTLTDGFVTRTTGDMTAWRKKLPMKTRKAIQDFRADYPQDGRAMALEAAWHLGVIRKTGVKNGSKWFGASLEEGKALYQDAIVRRPDDIIIRANYFMAMQALAGKIDVYDPLRQKPILQEILGLDANTDLDKKVQARMRNVLDNIEDPKIVKNLAEKFLDGK